MSISFYPVLPVWAILLVACALSAALAHGCRVLLEKRISPRWVGLLAALRALSILLFVALLLRPAVARTTERERKPQLLVLADTSASMLTSTAAGKPRLAAAIDRMQAGGMLDALSRNFELRWFAFDEKLRSSDLAALATVRTGGRSTNLEAALGEAADGERMARALGDRAASDELAGMLLVSDLNDSAARDLKPLARGLDVRLFPLLPDEAVEAAAPPRLEITSVQTPSRVMAGSVARFQAIVRRRGTTTAEATIELAEEGKPVARRQVTFQTGQLEQSVELFHRPTEQGVRRFRLSVHPTAPRQPLTLAPPLDVSVQVVGRAVNVLVIEDSIRWEFKYLKRLLEDDPHFSATTFLSRGSGIYAQSAESDSSLKLGGLPQSRAELAPFEIIVLGDVQPARWPAGLAAGVAHMVAHEGRSLVVLVGPHVDQLAAHPDLGPLLPVEFAASAGTPIEGPIEVRPSAGESTSETFFALGGSGALWQALPPLDQIYPVLRKRPAATPLIEARDRANAYGKLLVAAEHRVGRGRALLLATDTLWKWQMLAKADAEGNTPYRLFWQQALRALAPARWTDEQRLLALSTDQSSYTAGETVAATAEFEASQRPRNAQIELSVEPPGGREAPLAALTQSDRSGAATAHFAAERPGVYRLRATATSGGKTMAEVVRTIAVAAGPSEMDRLANNRSAAEGLASESGGRLVDFDLRQTWPTTDKTQPRRTSELVVSDLWNNFSLLVVLSLVMGFDWLLRLLKGFV